MNLSGEVGNELRVTAADKRTIDRLVVRNITRQTVLGERIEVANSGATRRKGLLGRDGLGTGTGLWIVPCESVHTFFMRFPIDLVYLDRKNRVRKVRHAVGPWRISACFAAHSVIELPAGTVRESGTVKGDIVELLASSLLSH
jgi:uncharacterized membrane protein (UPF0127 family)